MTSDHDLQGPIPLSILERVDQKCMRFEDAWLTGQRPRIETFIADSHGVERSKTFRELLLLDVDYRLRNADTPTAVEYERRFPDDIDLIEVVFRKIATETAVDVTLVDSGTPEANQAGRTVGNPLRYQILRRHAQGGLGEVFIAHDRHLNREVALKELQTRHADNANMRARFAREAEITGALEHPGIVPVHSLGNYEDGRLFYAMRFIDGVRLTDSVKEYFRNTACKTPAERSIEFRQLLVRFIDVCHTIEYAHSRGVLHRDLKPENIMLGKYGETIIVDWGLAKMQTEVEEGDGGSDALKATNVHLIYGDVAETRAGSAMGTPAFMSPEQAAGQRDQIGCSADVYGLGATLYFILTGSAPYSGGDTATILQRVREGQFPPPRQVRPETTRALQAICLKAMEVGPGDRYASARALSEDVEAWLADERTTAYRETFGERSRRFARRHHTPLWITGVFMIVLFAGLGVGMAVLGAKNRELHATNDRERAARQESQGRFELAMEAIECYYTDVSEDVALREPKLAELRKKMLSAPLDFYEKLQRDLQGDDNPASRTALADAYAAVGLITQQIGDFDQAIESYGREIAIRQSLAEESHTSDLAHRDLVDSHSALGHVHLAAGDRGLARAAFQNAWTVAKRLAEHDPTSVVSQGNLAQCYNNLATVSDIDEACEFLRQAIQIQEKLAAQSPDSLLHQSHLAKHCGNLGLILAEKGCGEEACHFLTRALEIAHRLVKGHPEFPRYREDLSSCCYNIANVQRLLGNSEQAVAYMEEALSVDKQLALDYANVTKYQWSLLKRYNNLGALLSECRQKMDAGEAYDKAVEVGTKLVASDPTTADYAIALGGAFCNRGNLSFQLGNIGEAVDECSHAIAALEPLLDRDNRTGNARQFLANSLTSRARALVVLQRYAEAVDDWDRSIELRPPKQTGTLDIRVINRVRACARSGDHVRCAQEVQRLASAVREPAERYHLASTLAIAAREVVQDESLAAERREVLANQYSQRAVDQLHEALRGGFFDDPARVRQLTEGSDLRPLQNHPQFRQLVEQLEKSQAVSNSSNDG